MKLHHRAKLTTEQVKDIRHLYSTWKANNGRKGYGALAEMFGCGQSTIRDIVTYRTRFSA